MNCVKNNSVQIDEEIFGVRKSEVLNYCMGSSFPGTIKWEKDNPIWDAYVPPFKSPKEAWEDEKLVQKAINNLYWILNKSIKEDKYKDFVEKHRKVFEGFRKNGKNEELLTLVLNRFTVAKIAPKVTALRACDMLKIIEESGIDLSSGVYCPMAGFGGIVEASKRWFKVHTKLQEKEVENLIESYDINKNFVNYYKFTGVRDIMAQKIETNKVCIVCPPFGSKYEHWKGTPNEMSDIPFEEWYKKIKEQIKAKDYIIIGPEIDKTGTGSNKGLDACGKKRCGLFVKTVGIQLWTDEMINRGLK